jgi:putative endonuclease
MPMAKDARRRFGDRGEDLAAAYFLARGFEVVARNWRCRSGEIDLIVSKDGAIHFVEVKTRRTMTYGYPEEAITPKKMEHLRRAIETYLQSAPVGARVYQADALAITLLPGMKPEFHYIENIH